MIAATKNDAFAALADPTRRRLLELLSRGDLRVNDMARRFEVSRPAISQHLRILREAGLVRETRVGRERHYRLHARPLRYVYDWVRRYEKFWDERLRKLGDTLDRDDL